VDEGDAMTTGWHMLGLTFHGSTTETNESIATADAIYIQVHGQWRRSPVVEDTGTSDVQIWIAKSTGLPLKEVIDSDAGDALTKSHSSLRFDYANIQAPPGVK
jgi:hypothetical protein